MPELVDSKAEPEESARPIAPRTVDGATLPLKKKQVNKREHPGANWVSRWPVAAGVLLGLFAPQLSSLAASYGPWGMRIVFPLVLLSGLHETGFSDELTRNLPQIMLFLQFPLEGLLTMMTLNRGGKLSGALAQLVFLHGVCVLVLWMVAGGAK
jgi:hypothetical protein